MSCLVSWVVSHEIRHSVSLWVHVSQHFGFGLFPLSSILCMDFCYVICSHPQRDLEAQNVLDYPPPSRGPLFQFPTKKAFLESPDQWLSPDLYCRSFGYTDTQILRLEMCSTIWPLPGAHRFNFLRKRHFWKARTSGSHQNFILGHLVTPTQRSKGSKCARLSAPFQGPTVSVSYKKGIFGKPRPMALTRPLL